MAEKKSGPVKPPIIDAQARPADKPAAEKSGTKPTEAGDKPAAKPAATGSATTTAKPAGPQTKPETGPQAAKPEASKTGAPSTDTPKTDSPKSDAAKPDAAKPDTAKPEATKPSEPAKPAQPSGPEPAPAAPATPWLPLAGAAAAGALVGFGLAYGAASLGYWPNQAASAQTALTELQTRTGRLENALALRESEASEAGARIEELTAQLAAIEPVSTEGFAAQADLEALSSQITDLSSRIEALAAGATGEEVSEVAESLSGLSSQVAALGERIDALEPQVSEIAPALERIDDLDARIADQARFEALSAERDRALRVPGAIGALETAIASGQPFAAQLAEISSLLPPLEVGDQTRQAAASGVLPPAQLLAELRAAIPAILAAAPRDADAGWAQSLFDQAVSALALRPTEGDTPQALVGRAEAALAAGDLDAAHQAFTAMPQPMQAAAPAFARELANARLAQTLIEDVRAVELAAAGEDAAQ